MSYSNSSGFNLVHRKDILNALRAIRSTQQILNRIYTSNRDTEIYQAGFNAAILAVAQMYGHTEQFLAHKEK